MWFQKDRSDLFLNTTPTAEPDYLLTTVFIVPSNMVHVVLHPIKYLYCIDCKAYSQV